MRIRGWFAVAAVAVLCGALAAQGQGKGTTMQHATGTFEVKVAPAEPSEFEKTHQLARYTLDKVWHGGFEGESHGEMLGGNEESTGAMAYTAVERMKGTLAGHSGTFIFEHVASMLKTDPSSAVMRVTIVPHSGTGELKGIHGELTITIDKTGHSYDLAYSLE